MTNYYELYRKHGLPLEEAYYLAENKYYISNEPIVKDMVKVLRKEICRKIVHLAGEEEGDLCRRYMRERGYYEAFSPFIFQPDCDFYGNYRRPVNQRIKNMENYLELYKKGLVSLRETYVLAKNKNFLLYDNCMLNMIFAIEDEIFKELIKTPVFGSDRNSDSIKITLKFLSEHLSHKPRTQINGCNKPIGWLMEFYMNEEGYTYERLACNSFIPIIKR